MRTNVSSVLVLPDDPCLTQPMAVPIRTADGKLMRRRLRKLLKEGKVVFVDARLIQELIDELHTEIKETESWVKELMALTCREDVAMLQSLSIDLDSRKDEYKQNSAEYTKLCFACRELWLRSLERVESIQIVKMYRDLKRRIAEDY